MWYTYEIIYSFVLFFNKSVKKKKKSLHIFTYH